VTTTAPAWLTAPRRPGRTYISSTYGREVYADTGRPVDEKIGTHVVLWIVDDADAWAASVEAEGDHQVGLWPKSRRYIGEHRRQQAYESAKQIRERGPYRSVRSTYYRQADAVASVQDLRRAHPNPGVRYEVAVVEQADACPTGHCRQPRFFADGTWWHDLGGYPTECGPAPEPDEPEEEPAPG